MDIGFIQDYIVIVVLGICLCIGYVIKTSLDFIPNKYIPAIMLALGTAINCIINWGHISAAVVLGGMLSGLASTGLHQAMKQLLQNEDSPGDKLQKKSKK